MSSTSTQSGSSIPSGALAAAERVALKRLLGVGPFILVITLIANFVIRAIALTLFDFRAFNPLAGTPFISLTVVGVLLALIVFAMVARFSKRPYWLYTRIALVALALSFIPDLLLLVAPMPSPPGSFSNETLPPNAAGSVASVEGVLVLMLMHVVTAVITVYSLTRWTREQA